MLSPRIVLKDAGLASRAYCYITDAMRLFWRSLFALSTVGHVLNMANDQREITIYDLASLIHALCGVTEPVTCMNRPNDAIASAPSRVCASMKKAMDMLNYIPHVPLEEGLARTIDWNRGKLFEDI